MTRSMLCAGAMLLALFQTGQALAEPLVLDGFFPTDVPASPAMAK